MSRKFEISSAGDSSASAGAVSSKRLRQLCQLLALSFSRRTWAHHHNFSVRRFDESRSRRRIGTTIFRDRVSLLFKSSRFRNEADLSLTTNCRVRVVRSMRPVTGGPRLGLAALGDKLYAVLDDSQLLHRGSFEQRWWIVAAALTGLRLVS
jgi:hypothetical protein